MAKLPNIKTVIGLDIEPSYISAAEVKVNGSVTVSRAATIALAPGVVRDGEVVDGEALAETLKDLFRDNKLDRRVRLGVASPRIVVRTLDLPPIADGKELAAAVRFKAPETIPMPLEQAVLDYQPLGIVETPEGQRMRVLIVAARRDMIDRLLAAARRAGLRPEGIDLSAFAMIRALHVAPAADAVEDVVLYVNAGGLTNLAVASGAQCLFTRVASTGVEGMVTELAERRALTIDHARAWLAHVGLDSPLQEVDGDPQIVADARTVLADGARRIADDVRNSLEFYAAQEDATPVQRAVLTGPAASIGGFADELSRMLALPVTAGSVAESRAGALGGVDAARVTVAAGLAVGEGVS